MSYSIAVIFAALLIEIGIGATAQCTMDQDVFINSFYNDGLIVIVVWTTIALVLSFISLLIIHEIEKII